MFNCTDLGGRGPTCDIQHFAGAIRASRSSLQPILKAHGTQAIGQDVGNKKTLPILAPTDSAQEAG